MRQDEFEKQALAELEALYRFARFLTRSTVEAEDLVQDVYARAFRPQSIRSFAPRNGGMRAWLMTIARSIFFGRLERDRAARRLLDQAGPQEAPDPQGASQMVALDGSAAGAALDAVLDELTPELRDVLWLWAVEGLKYREIAQALDIPLGTVMSRLHRARTAAAESLLRGTRPTANRPAPSAWQRPSTLKAP